MQYKVLIADDHKIVRRGLSHLIDSDDRFIVVAEAQDGSEAIRNAAQTRPDVAVLDINMPVTDGITAAREIKTISPDTGIVMLTIRQEPEIIRSAFAAGAIGFVLKTSSEEELFHALESAARGERFVARGAADVVIDSFLYLDRSEDGSAGALILRTLSGRERQVLQMLAEGAPNPRIASTLNVSVKTVETYRGRLMQKLGVASFAELVRVAVRAGLVDREEV